MIGCNSGTRVHTYNNVVKVPAAGTRVILSDYPVVSVRGMHDGCIMHGEVKGSTFTHNCYMAASAYHEGRVYTSGTRRLKLNISCRERSG